MKYSKMLLFLGLYTGGTCDDLASHPGRGREQYSQPPRAMEIGGIRKC